MYLLINLKSNYISIYENDESDEFVIKAVLTDEIKEAISSGIINKSIIPSALHLAYDNSVEYTLFNTVDLFNIIKNSERLSK